ncbi:MAG: quinolinate synthase NadA [Oscillospiraceae bacterium]
MIRNLQDQILKLKKEKDIAILAHSYQSPEILEIADLKGDSFQLSKAAATLPNRTVILCGVRFMADTVKILSPEKTVILPAPQATCPMAEQIRPEEVLAYKKAHPGHKVMAYINTTTELKAVCDICVTSSSAEKIVSRIPETDILFIPDQNLGAYIQQKVPGKRITFMNGCCPVHNEVTVRHVQEARAAWPDAKLLVHPECPKEVAALADMVGSRFRHHRLCAAIRLRLHHRHGKEHRRLPSLVKPERNFPVLPGSDLPGHETNQPDGRL